MNATKDSRPRPSRVLAALRAGRRAVCFKSNLNCSRPLEIAALAGFDAVWVCQEHVPTDYGVLEKQILAAKAHDTDCIVRVPKGSYSDLIRPLELDATGIMVPHLMSLAEARDLVRMVRFQPLGRRPVDGGNADAMFGMLSMPEYTAFCNAQRMIIVQIEDPEVLPELDEICALDGIDMIFFGPGDYSHALGTPGDFSNPELDRVRRLVVETAHRHGKFAGTVAIPTAAACFDLGYDFVNCASDVGLLGNGCRTVLDQLPPR